MESNFAIHYSLFITHYSLLISVAPFRMTTAKVVSLYRILHTFLVIPSKAKESTANEE